MLRLLGRAAASAARAQAAAGGLASAARIASLVDPHTASLGARGAVGAAGAAGGGAAAARAAALAALRRSYGFAAQPLRAAGPAAPHGLGGAAIGAVRRKATLAAPGFAPAGAAAAAAPPAAALLGPAALTAGLTAGQRRALALWLGGCSAWVFSLVVLGGVTRLTRSGLSMTGWRFAGEAPPRSDAEWAEEFGRYRASPEFRLLNRSMDLPGFQRIYWVEWAHRWWGRGLGLAFALPLAAFAARGAVTAPLARRLGVLMAAGGAQGLVGWWMVRSGLEAPAGNAVPRVAPARLAAHLASAFAIYTGLVWTTLSVAAPTWAGAAGAAPAATAAAAALRRAARPVAALLALTAASGAFVAGNDAGRAFNTFPLMAGRWVPEEYWALPGWRNAVENTAAVQLHHRALALATLGAVGGLWTYGRGLPALPRAPRLLLAALAAGAVAQASLGVATLLLHVPVPLASAHQAGALGLMTAATALLYSVRAPAPGPLARLGAPLGLAAVVAAGVGAVRSQ
jgi:cytochrome c oxidase assembly protein subunit 15